ncbi:MAG TPA: hypothetical protein VN670_10200 [Acidobacteriaceae bacterium]|nr:hypothetical protein [Acidobacteriaceae bacterium]
MHKTRGAARAAALQGFILTCLLCFFVSARASERTVTVDYRTFPGLAAMDGNWAALLAASDGKVYAGLACHGCNGHLVYYDSKADRMVDIGDLNKLTGQEGLAIGPQSKIHAKFGEGKDGRIYFATHAGWWFDYSRYATPEGYPGSHYMAYDPRSGTVQDFGIGPRYEGMNTGAYDPKYNRIYGLTHPRGHFVYYDVASGAKVDNGRMNNWDSICRTLGIDDDGNVYGSFGAGHIYKYSPVTDTITELQEKLPIRQKGISLGRDYLKSETAWRVVVWDHVNKVFYGVDESETVLFSFNPASPPDEAIKRLGQMAIPELADKRYVPYATLSLTIGHDRKLYYAAAEKEFDYGGSGEAGKASHLMTYDLRTGKIEDLGEMHLPDGRPVLGTNSASTGPDGTIYFVGAIGVKNIPGEEGKSAGMIGDTPYRLALFIYHPKAQN